VVTDPLGHFDDGDRRGHDAGAIGDGQPPGSRTASWPCSGSTTAARRCPSGRRFSLSTSGRSWWSSRKRQVADRATYQGNTYARKWDSRSLAKEKNLLQTGTCVFVFHRLMPSHKSF